jgi:hypothetical protein
MDSERVLSSDIHAVWPKARYLPAKTRAAIDALAAKIPPMIAHSGVVPPAARRVVHEAVSRTAFR